MQKLRSIAGVDGPIEAQIHGQVHCEEPIVSPLTDAEGAGFHWTFHLDTENRRQWWTPIPRTAGLSPYYGDAMDDPFLGIHLYGQVLRIACDQEMIQLLLPEANVKFARDDGRVGEPLMRPLPPELSEIGTRARRRDGGAILFREQALCHGAPVLLKATIERIAPIDLAPYRASHRRATHIVRADLGAVSLTAV